MTDYIKLPRLYVDHELTAGHIVTFGEDQAHYLRAVLRQNPGDRVRVFNGRDGEYICTLDTVGKKAVTGTATDQLCAQPPAPLALHLYFAPIKKARMDMLIEKAVELGATHLHPV
ncbi:MAG: 16S rRNA (uracil(1498)-N(3))-methyltransferase, partial [Alphaproteobacteria bacterium]|nr:16S rRNA (uracil(1498)-N(3))-methyltransferase [Alphaproteobacteria bacterium]